MVGIGIFARSVNIKRRAPNAKFTGKRRTTWLAKKESMMKQGDDESTDPAQSECNELLGNELIAMQTFGDRLGDVFNDVPELKTDLLRKGLISSPTPSSPASGKEAQDERKHEGYRKHNT